MITFTLQDMNEDTNNWIIESNKIYPILYFLNTLKKI